MKVAPNWPKSSKSWMTWWLSIGSHGDLGIPARCTEPKPFPARRKGRGGEAGRVLESVGVRVLKRTRTRDICVFGTWIMCVLIHIYICTNTQTLLRIGSYTGTRILYIILNFVVYLNLRIRYTLCINASIQLYIYIITLHIVHICKCKHTFFWLKLQMCNQFWRGRTWHTGGDLFIQRWLTYWFLR
jgi:hypothetical protein